MSASVNNLTLTLNRMDAAGVSVETRTVGPITFEGTAGELDFRSAPDTSSHAIDLPITAVNQIYIHNTHATGVLTLVGTINGGSSQTVVKIGPDAVFVYWEPATGQGFTALSYTASVTATTFEMFLGG